MMANLWPLLRVELIRLRRTPSEFLAHVLLPVAAAFLILGLPGLSVRGVTPIHLKVHAAGLEDAATLRRFLRANQVRLVGDPQPRRSLITGRASVGLSISPGFDRALRSARPASLRVLYVQDDGASRARAATLGQLLERFRSQQLAALFQELGGPPQAASALVVSAEPAEASLAGARLRLAQRLPYLLLLSLAAVLPASTTTFFSLRGARTIEPLLSLPYHPAHLLAASSSTWLIRSLAFLLSASGTTYLLTGFSVFNIALPRPRLPALVASIGLFVPLACLLTILGMLLSLTSPSSRHALALAAAFLLILSGVNLFFASRPSSLLDLNNFRIAAFVPILGQVASAYNLIRLDRFPVWSSLTATASSLGLTVLLFVVATRLMRRVPLVLRLAHE